MVTRMFLGCFNKVYSVFQDSFKGVSRKIKGCFNGVSSGFQGCLKEVEWVLREFPRSFKDVLRNF